MRRIFLLLLACMLVMQVPVAGAQSQPACEGQRPSIGNSVVYLDDAARPTTPNADFFADLEDESSDARIRFEVTVEDDKEVRSVSLELVHLDVEYALLLPISVLNKTLHPTSGSGETSTWTYELPLSSQRLVFGVYDLKVRALDIEGCVASQPAAGEESEITLTVVGIEAELEDGEDPFLYVPDRIDPSRPHTSALKYAATGGPRDLVVDYHGEIVLKGDDRLRVFLDEPRLKYPHKLTYELRGDGGAFTEEQVLDPKRGLGAEILAEDVQEVIVRYYTRDDQAFLRQFNVDADNDGRLDFVPPAMVLRLKHVQVDRSAPAVLQAGTGGTVFQGMPFNLSVLVEDDTAVAATVTFPGAVRGAQVRAGDDDHDLSLTTFRDAAVRYDDRGAVFDPAHRPFGSGDVLYLDTDGDRAISIGDVVLSGAHAGGIVRADYLDLDRTLIDPPSAFVDAYVDVNSDRAYGEGDLVVMDDPGGSGEGRGTLSALDLRLSGGRQGKLVLEQEGGARLRDGRLGTFAFHDQSGDGVFNLTEPVYYTGTSFVNEGDVRVANALRGQLHRAGSDAGGVMMLELGPFTLDRLGNQTYRLELTDAVGNRHISQRTVHVVPPHTTMVIQDLSVLTPTRLAGEPVVFEAKVNQTDGVADIDVTVLFEAQGERDAVPATVLFNGSQIVDHERVYRPGRHNMTATIVPPAGAEVQNGSVLEDHVAFEVFFGKVVTPDDVYWIRANDLGLAAQAVRAPGSSDEEEFPLERRIVEGREVQAFDVNGTQLYWDPHLRNGTNKAVTEFETMPAPPTDRTDDSPVPLALLVAAVALALVRRRSRR